MKNKNQKIKFCAVVVLLITCYLSVLFKPTKVYAEYETSAKAMIVLEQNSGRVILQKNIHQKLAMASTTKIVTALTVLNNCKNINQIVKIHNGAVGVPGTSIYLKHGEEITVKELLYGMMLPSGNDAATALAYYVGGTIEQFCTLMNECAVNLGAVNSRFKNPHGLDEAGHYTTAYDLAVITAQALKNETFKQIVTTKSTRIKGSSIGSYRYLKNKNKLLNTLDGCIGVKTGFTNNAGRCLVSATQKNGTTYVCVCLNCGPMFEESASALNFANENYLNVELLPEYKIVKPVTVNDGKVEYVKVYSKRSFYYPLTASEASRIEYRYNLPNSIDAPVKKDEVVGQIEIYLDNHLLFSEKVYTINSVQKIGVWSNIQDIISNW